MDSHEEEEKEEVEGEEDGSTQHQHLAPRITLMIGHNASDCILSLNDGAHLIYASSTGLRQRSPFFRGLVSTGLQGGEDQGGVCGVALPRAAGAYFTLICTEGCALLG